MADFLSDTFDKEEIFVNQLDIFNASIYYIEEIKSQVVGRCYMVCSILPLRKNTWFAVPLQNKHKYKSKIHLL